MFDFSRGVGEYAYCDWVFDLIREEPEYPYEYEDLPLMNWYKYQPGKVKYIQQWSNEDRGINTLTAECTWQFGGSEIDLQIYGWAATAIFEGELQRPAIFRLTDKVLQRNMNGELVGRFTLQTQSYITNSQE